MGGRESFRNKYLNLNISILVIIINSSIIHNWQESTILTSSVAPWCHFTLGFTFAQPLFGANQEITAKRPWKRQNKQPALNDAFFHNNCWTSMDRISNDVTSWLNTCWLSSSSFDYESHRDWISLSLICFTIYGNQFASWTCLMRKQCTINLSRRQLTQLIKEKNYKSAENVACNIANGEKTAFKRLYQWLTHFVTKFQSRNVKVLHIYKSTDAGDSIYCAVETKSLLIKLLSLAFLTSFCDWI